jgi:hypothetical protein
MPPHHIVRTGIDRHTTRCTALDHLLETFFDGSAEGAVAALLDGEARKLTGEELDRLAGLIEKARKEGR